MKVDVVNITLVNGVPTVDSWDVELSKSRKDRVKWRCANEGEDKDFEVCFKNDSPFQWKHFNKARPESGEIRDNVPVNTTYLYSVEVEGKTVDPTVVIRP